MTTNNNTLLCWHSKRAGVEVLVEAIKCLKNRRVLINRAIVLVQTDTDSSLYLNHEFGDIGLRFITASLENPANHNEIYQRLETSVLPELKDVANLHINVSPGTPAMHAVWLILHARGHFPSGTKLWSSQFNPDTKRTSISSVDFNVNTYLAEISAISNSEGSYALYGVDPKSAARREALATLKEFAQVPKAPLLVLGERGTGKTRLIESVVGIVKQKKVVTLACGGLDSQVVDSMLFGHVKGAFTGAETQRSGLLREAEGKVLFLDEIQDLPTSVQRKLVRVLQDNHHYYRSVGSDKEETSDFELVCASNKTIKELATTLDADFFDRISMLTITIPPLRICREDLLDDWQKIWGEVNVNPSLPKHAPTSRQLNKLLESSSLAGNLRDLKKLAFITCAYMNSYSPTEALSKAICSLQAFDDIEENEGTKFSFGDLSNTTKDELDKLFKYELARAAKRQFGTWSNAGKNLQVDQKTLQKYMKNDS
ncbi:sigma 54-interacting transcriptional regulator [Shewanella spartinae]|uniref:sigma 54-interacting transcriptional regulator n=1 Tax=Shewanella spartinae TaxID=2864205 RepID=UPI001C6558B1|nr:sigma 54-interacting transcriptional regulator [Shewanella spartinae]QYJ92060.1 sigma 54-interacting transcriptional regulator [Shewanella spartinae]